MDLDKIMNLKEHYKKEPKHNDAYKPYYSLIRSFLNVYNLPIDNFERNITTLEIMNDGYPGSGMSYDHRNNGINNVTDKGDFVHELLHMSSYDSTTKTMGCVYYEGESRIGGALNEGITDFCTSLVIKKYDQKYPIEAFIVTALVDMYGANFIIDHFNAKGKKVYGNFNEDREIVDVLLSYLDKYNIINTTLQDILSSLESENLDYYNEYRDRLKVYNYTNLIDSLSGALLKLFELANTKGYSYSRKYFSLLKNLFNKDTPEINYLKNSIELTDYVNYEDFLDYIKELTFYKEMDI